MKQNSSTLAEIALNTRADFQKLLFEYLIPLKSHFTEEKTGIQLGVTSTHYENKTIPMEAFVRPLWGLVPYWASEGEDDTFSSIYRKGLTAGTNPENHEYWGEFRDLDQKFVEMAGISYGLLLVPDLLWEPLSETEKENLATWLNKGINHYECSNSNWQFFCVLTNLALKSLGRDYSKERLELGMERIEQFYVGDGWYTDGKGGQQDYYIAMAFHFYGLIYAKFMAVEEPARCRELKHRAELFACDFIYWFDENGSAIPYGRSLTYRFAQVSFFSACLLHGIEVLSMGVLKGIIFRHFRYWVDKSILDNAGILSIGYEYPNLIMSESYNAPGSPYWCMKAFAFLALDKNHPFWAVKEEPLPQMDGLHLISSASMLMQRINGRANLYVPGRTLPHQFPHVEEKYSKFVYSSKYGFSISRSQKTLKEAAPDSMLAFVINGYVFVKGIINSQSVTADRVQMEWSPWPGINVKTEIIPTKDGHIRKHRICSDISCKAYECGFSVDIDDRFVSESLTGDGWSMVQNNSGSCKVIILSGEGHGEVLEADVNTNLMHPKTAIPMVWYDILPGEMCISSQIIEK